MASTKKISLFYNLTRTDGPVELVPPPAQALQRKDEWLKIIREGIHKMGESRIIKVTYELFNPEVEQQRKFFNGPVVDYFVIQSTGITSGDVPRLTHDQYRETILSDSLGYDVKLVGRTERRRKSTADFLSTQRWHDFLETLRETVFEPNGYEMPDSEAFWELSKKHGYEQAKTISIEQLQRRMIAKMQG